MLHCCIPQSRKLGTQLAHVCQLRNQPVVFRLKCSPQSTAKPRKVDSGSNPNVPQYSQVGVAVVGSSNVHVSYSTLTTCMKSSFGDFGHRSWCYGRGVVQCTCELFHSHHMHQKLGCTVAALQMLRSNANMSYSTLTTCMKSSLGDFGHHRVTVVGSSDVQAETE